MCVCVRACVWGVCVGGVLFVIIRYSNTLVCLSSASNTLGLYLEYDHLLFMDGTEDISRKTLASYILYKNGLVLPKDI